MGQGCRRVSDQEKDSNATSLDLDLYSLDPRSSLILNYSERKIENPPLANPESDNTATAETVSFCGFRVRVRISVK